MNAALALLTAALSTLWAVPPGRGVEDPLEGTEWRMRFRSEDGWLPLSKADRLRFEGGVFSSSEGEAYGFTPTGYEFRQNEDGTSWVSTQTNPDGESTRWEGCRRGDRMEGRFTWTWADGRARTYRFEAEPR